MIYFLPGHGPEDFQRLLRECLEKPGRTIAERLNSKAYMIVKRAQYHTKRAVRAEIEALGLRTISQGKGRTNSRGRFVPGRRKFEFNAKEASENFKAACLKHMGGSAFRNLSKKTGKTTAEMARKWIAKKLRSIGFLASTWRPILRKLDRYSKEKGMVGEGGPVYSGPNNQIKSYAIPAKEEWNPKVEFGNVIGESFKGENLRTYAQQLLENAMSAAIRDEVESMAEHLGKPLAQELDKVFYGH